MPNELPLPRMPQKNRRRWRSALPRFVKYFDPAFARCGCKATHKYKNPAIPCISAWVTDKGSWHLVKCDNCDVEWHEKAYQFAERGKRRMITDKQYRRDLPDWP